MFEIVPSQWMKKCFEEIDFAFTDFQKATLIWNAPGRLRQEILDALEELSEDTRDETLRRQINERLNYEKKTFETFIYNQSGKYVYVVEDLEYEKEKIANIENFIPSCKELLSCYWDLSVQDRNKALKMLLESVEYTKTKRNRKGDKDNPTFTLNLKPRIPRI